MYVCWYRGKCSWCYFVTLQIDIPTLVTENLGKEGLKHLEMYLRAKEKGYLKYNYEYWFKVMYIFILTLFIFYVYLPNIPEIDLIACTAHVILGNLCYIN